MLAREKVIILTVLVLAVLAGGLFLAFTPPLYRASTLILIDAKARRVPQNAIVPGGGASSTRPDAAMVDTQLDTHVEIIRSDAVVRRTMDELSLFTDREYDGRGTWPGLQARLMNALTALVGGQAKAPIGIDQSERALETFRNTLTIKRVGTTDVVGIDVLSRDPEKAARIANALVQNYVADQSVGNRDSTRETIASLTAKLDELRERVRVADNAVEAFKAKNGITGAQGVLVSDQQVQDINSRLVIARARSAELKVRYEQIQRLTKAGGAQAGAMAEALQSGVITNLRQALGDIARREAEALSQWSPGHPSLRAIQAERDNADKLLTEELARIVQSARNDYDVARSSEEQLAKTFADLKKSLVDINLAQVKVRELQREADAARAIFETFLARARQAGEQEDVSTTNTRILTRATTPFRAVFPDTLLVLGISLAGGLLLGVALTGLRRLRLFV